jgi:hypothetical protein
MVANLSGKVNCGYFVLTVPFVLSSTLGSADHEMGVENVSIFVRIKQKSVSDPDDQNQINLGRLPKGHYTVRLNGNQIGELDS